jgi:uncharacterized protein
MLSYNVAGLLREPPGTTRSDHVTIPPADLPIAEDLELAAPVVGDIRLARTGRGLIVHGAFDTSLAETCSRCLGPAVTPVHVEIDQEALPTLDIATGTPIDLSEEPDALQIDEHHELDLEPPVREAISLAEPIAPLCRADCAGLCPTCGADLNASADHHHDEDDIDPRLAGLAALLNNGDEPNEPGTIHQPQSPRKEKD